MTLKWPRVDPISGAHFAGCENPELLGRDFAEFLELAWPRQASKL